jgi:hypothetical protein
MSAEQWAREQAERYIAAQVAAIEDQRRMYLEEIQKQSQLEADRGMALAQALQQMNIPGRISEVYGNASADIGGLAQAFSGTLRDTAQADTAAQTRMLSGTGQEGAVRNQGENLGNVSYGLGGYIPARSMSESGAAFAAQAALEPSFAARIGQEKAAEVHASGLTEIDDYAKAIAEARAGAPELINELLGNQQDAALDDRKFRLSQQKEAYSRLKSERDFLVKQAYLSLASGDRKRSNEYLGLAQEKEKRMQTAAQGYDMSGNLLPGFTVDANGNVIKRTTAKSPQAKAAEKAKSNRATARKDREGEFVSAQKELPDEIAKLTIKAKNSFEEDRKPSYQTAFRKLWEKYKYLLRHASTGGQAKLRKRLTDLIDDALLAEGIAKSRGAAGHPGK